MKTLNELFDEISNSKELQDKLVSVSQNSEELVRFVKEQGCEATVSEILTKLKELSDNQLFQVAGGVLDPEYAYDKRRQ